MAEEQRFEEGHCLCANNCGFFGSPATLDLCSECYRDHCVKEEEEEQRRRRQIQDSAAAGKVAAENSRPTSGSSISISSPTRAAIAVADQVEEAEKKEDEAAAGPSRCANCRKRLGLTGFQCRCGGTYCGAHRYAEQHGCSFDFKAAGRAVIARTNPVVKADKLRKI